MRVSQNLKHFQWMHLGRRPVTRSQPVWGARPLGLRSAMRGSHSRTAIVWRHRTIVRFFRSMPPNLTICARLSQPNCTACINCQHRLSNNFKIFYNGVSCDAENRTMIMTSVPHFFMIFLLFFILYMSFRQGCDECEKALIKLLWVTMCCAKGDNECEYLIPVLERDPGHQASMFYTIYTIKLKSPIRSIRFIHLYFSRLLHWYSCEH